MVKTIVQAFKDDKGQDALAIMGDIDQIQQDVGAIINRAVIADDRGRGLVEIQDYLTSLYTDTVLEYSRAQEAKRQAAEKKGE